MGASYLYDRMTDLLEAAAAALAEARTTHPVPDRRFVSQGVPTFEGCDQLTVHLDTPRAIWHRSSPAGAVIATSCEHVPIAVFVVSLWRCYPTSSDGEAIADTVLDAAAEGLAVDLWALLTGLYVPEFEGLLFDGAGCKETLMGDVRGLPLAPQLMGGGAGWEVRVALTLGDAGPT